MLYCTATKMDFSQVVGEELMELVANPPTPPTAAHVKWGGSWHCPADGTPMREIDGAVTCDACERSLPPRLLYGLVEFHIHR